MTLERAILFSLFHVFAIDFSYQAVPLVMFEDEQGRLWGVNPMIASHAGQPEVEEHDFRVVLGDGRERSRAIACRRDLVTHSRRSIASVTAASSLSSTTSTLRRRPRTDTGEGGGAYLRASMRLGIQTVNSAPLPFPSLVAATVPPCNSTSLQRAVSTRHYRGLGLGLYIVHTIVEALGGAIFVESESETGTRFTVELPQAQVH